MNNQHNNLADPNDPNLYVPRVPTAANDLKVSLMSNVYSRDGPNFGTINWNSIHLIIAPVPINDIARPEPDIQVPDDVDDGLPSVATIPFNVNHFITQLLLCQPIGESLLAQAIFALTLFQRGNATLNLSTGTIIPSAPQEEDESIHTYNDDDETWVTALIALLKISKLKENIGPSGIIGMQQSYVRMALFPDASRVMYSIQGIVDNEGNAILPSIPDIQLYAHTQNWVSNWIHFPDQTTRIMKTIAMIFSSPRIMSGALPPFVYDRNQLIHQTNFTYPNVERWTRVADQVYEPLHKSNDTLFLNTMFLILLAV